MNALSTIRAATGRYLERSTGIAPLATFRVVFGAMMVFSTVRFWSLGWIESQYIQPAHHFRYFGFEWVPIPGELGLYLLFGVMLVSAVGITLGAFYRWSAALFFVAFTWVELLDVTYYLNHYYFVSIVAGMLIFLPANRSFSLDALRYPELRATQVPRWTLDVLKVQIGLVYFYAGIAKVTEHWLLDAMPLALWLPANDTLPLIGSLFRHREAAYLMSWAGMIFDTTTPFLLLWRRTRLAAYVAVVVFHTLTGMMFQIGVFPVVMIGATLIFFSESAHNRAQEFARRAWRRLWPSRSQQAPAGSRTAPTLKIARWVPALLALHLLVQLVLPWRYLAWPGNLFWTEQGYRFSWRVMLMEKAGTATFFVKDGADGREGIVTNCEFLNAHQEKQMATQPDLVLQFAHIIRDHYRAAGMADPRVRAEIWVTLNGERSHLLVDPRANLAAIEEGWGDHWWVTDPADPELAAHERGTR